MFEIYLRSQKIECTHNLSIPKFPLHSSYTSKPLSFLMLLIFLSGIFFPRLLMKVYFVSKGFSIRFATNATFSSGGPLHSFSTLQLLQKPPTRFCPLIPNSYVKYCLSLVLFVEDPSVLVSVGSHVWLVERNRAALRKAQFVCKAQRRAFPHHPLFVQFVALGSDDDGHDWSAT